jgi:hypothetical protein
MEPNTTIDNEPRCPYCGDTEDAPSNDAPCENCLDKWDNEKYNPIIS